MLSALTYVNAAIIIDHDGGIDDVIATMLHLIKHPDQVKAICIAPADSYADPALWIMNELQNKLHTTIPVGIGSDEGINTFPWYWRDDSWKMTELPVWEAAIPERTLTLQKNFKSSTETLRNALMQTKEKVTILETGPCSNLADMLTAHPELKHKIERIFIMGGALRVKGNVEEAGHDGSAEWNIYNNPEAFYTVLSSGVPITLIPLDATQYTPIRASFIDTIEKNSYLFSCSLVSQSLRLIQSLIDVGQYMFWDTLTSAAIINPAIIKTEVLRVNVMLNGTSMGKTYEDPAGFPIEVALWADQDLFEHTVLSILTNNKSEPHPKNITIIGICGGTGSGKTTLSSQLKAMFPNDITVIAQDNYYKDISHLSPQEIRAVNFDHPDSIDFALLEEHIKQLKTGNAVAGRTYNFTTHTNTPGSIITPSSIIIVEGILLFAVPEIRDAFDIKIFMESDDDIRLLRCIKRDIAERGKSLEEINQQYLTSIKPMHSLFIASNKNHADFIVPSTKNASAVLAVLKSYINQQRS